MKISRLQNECHKIAVSKGWWDEKRNIGEALCLIHSEVSEALEEYRRGIDLQEIYFDGDGKPQGFPIELADTVIRLLDLCGGLRIDLEDAIKVKMKFNKSRSKRHGNKLA